MSSYIFRDDFSFFPLSAQSLQLDNETVRAGYAGLHPAKERVNLWSLHLDVAAACHGSLDKWAELKETLPLFIKVFVISFSEQVIRSS